MTSSGRGDRLVEGEHGQQHGAIAKKGAQTGPNPTDRGKPGVKRHLIVDARELPLAVLSSAANVHDAKLIEPLLDAVEPVRQRVGRPRQRPVKVHADKGYDYPRCRRALSRRHTQIRIARRGIESKERLGKHRWVVERTIAWLNQFRRLRIRYERRAEIYDAFLHLGCAIIAFRFLQRFC